MSLFKPTSKYTLEFFKEVCGNPSDYETAQHYFEKTKHLHSSLDLLNQANSFFYWFDFVRMKYLFVNSNIEKVTGYTAKEWINGGPGFAFSTVYEEDVVRLQACHKELFRYFYSLSIHERNRVRYGYETRIVTKYKKVIWIIQQGSFIEIDQEGKPIISFDVTLDITDFKKDNKVMSLNMINDTTNEKHIVHFPISGDEIFSFREKEILHCLEKRMSSKEIADILEISVHTVDTHRRNMIKKSKCYDTSELIIYAKNNGLI